MAINGIRGNPRAADFFPMIMSENLKIREPPKRRHPYVD
jgi:hypothetical protein